MNSRLYTNTSKVGGVIGLIVVSLAVSYVSANSTQIVNDTVSLAKKGLEKAKECLHHGKQHYQIWQRDFDGKIYDTGKRVWK